MKLSKLSTIIGIGAAAVCTNAQAYHHHHHHDHHHGGDHHHRKLLGRGKCGTRSPTDEDNARADLIIQNWKRVQNNTEMQEGSISQLPAVIEVPTYVHIIHPGDITKNEVHGKVQQQIDVLNAAYDGYTFTLKGTTETNDKAWWTAGQGTVEQDAMKKKLHKGDCGTLNIYYNCLDCSEDGTVGDDLGYSPFPWECKGEDITDDGVGKLYCCV